MDWRLSGTLTTTAAGSSTFAGCRVEALFDRKPPEPEPELSGAALEFAEAATPTLIDAGTIEPPPIAVDIVTPPTTVTTLGPAPARRPIASRVSALTDAAGAFTLVFPDRDEIVGDQVEVEAYSAIGTLIGKRTIAAANFDDPADIAVTPVPPVVLGKPHPLTTPTETRRIQGRIIERRGRALPSSLQVLLLAREEGVAEEVPLEPILVSRADASGYFSGSVRNRAYSTVVAVVSGVEGDIPVRLDDSLVPSRVPVVIGLNDMPGPTNGSTSDDCDCHNGMTTPRTPTQENIADAPGTFSADLGTGECIKFNVPNRAIEEFDFFSVVRTTEPHISGVVRSATFSTACLWRPVRRS